jgi:hypothetical protein
MSHDKHGKEVTDPVLAAHLSALHPPPDAADVARLRERIRAAVARRALQQRPRDDDTWLERVAGTRRFVMPAALAAACLAVVALRQISDAGARDVSSRAMMVALLGDTAQVAALTVAAFVPASGDGLLLAQPREVPPR